jgi:glycine/D-amino acid oxidase-like deaminating enzyme
VRERIAVDGVCGGLYYPMVARIQPARLAFGLAAAVERRGVRIYERSRAETLTPCPGRPGSRPATVTANGATVRAGTVLLCTEGYSGPLAGRRRLIPINSSMVATRPLSAADWASIGWSHGECLSDSAHAFIYSQRTTDDRIAIGGRGRPYRYGSGTGGDGVTAQRTVAQLRERLERYFPQAGFEIEHAWSGVLGVTRDWCAGIEVDRRHGIGHCFGYAGHGVTSANLGGRILADLTTGAQNDLTTLPLVGHRARNWEPEPLRWLGVHGLYRLFEYADRREEASGTATTSPGARLAGRIAGLE